MNGTRLNVSIAVTVQKSTSLREFWTSSYTIKKYIVKRYPLVFLSLNVSTGPLGPFFLVTGTLEQRLSKRYGIKKKLFFN